MIYQPINVGQAGSQVCDKSVLTVLLPKPGQDCKQYYISFTVINKSTIPGEQTRKYANFVLWAGLGPYPKQT
jgi:hypothetical protein